MDGSVRDFRGCKSTVEHSPLAPKMSPERMSRDAAERPIEQYSKESRGCIVRKKDASKYIPSRCRIHVPIKAPPVAPLSGVK